VDRPVLTDASKLGETCRAVWKASVGRWIASRVSASGNIREPLTHGLPISDVGLAGNETRPAWPPWDGCCDSGEPAFSYFADAESNGCDHCGTLPTQRMPESLVGNTGADATI